METTSEETRQQIRAMAKAQASTACWKRGDLRYLTKKHGQRRAYDFVKKWVKDNPGKPGPVVLNTHRGCGKSVLDMVFILERCLQKPGTIAYFGSATEKDAIAIFSQTMDDPIRGYKPSGIRLDIQKLQTRVRVLSWPEDAPDSIINIVGLKEYAGSLRGRRANIVVLDELREFDQPIDNVTSVVKPMFIGKDDPLLVITSTPPDMLAHPFVSYFIPRAIATDAYIWVSGSSNEDFTEDEIAKIVDDPSDKLSLEYRREIEAELVEDLTKIMFPEFVSNKDVIVEERERPEYFFPFMGGDLGLVDYNAVLFSYIDFEKQLLVIEDEYMEHGISTGELCQNVRHEEVGLYFGTHHFDHTRRFCDNDPQAITDFQVDHNYTWEATQKHDRPLAVANLKMMFAKRRIRIHPRCKSLIYQLSNAIRKEGDTANIETVKQVKLKKDDPIIGHWDAIDALIYLNRMLGENGAFMQNPFPYRVLATHEFDELGKKPERIVANRVTREPAKITRDNSLVTFGERLRIER